MPRLLILRLPAYKHFSHYCFIREELDSLSSMQQLEHVEEVRVDSANLSHPFLISKCYPALQVVISKPDTAGDVAEWAQRGCAKQVQKLYILSGLNGVSAKPSMSPWPVFTALRTLGLISLDLTPGLQQLRELTQLKHLEMRDCDPTIHSLNQLPSGICSLTCDNLRGDAALHEQQQQVLNTSSPQLPHLTRLVLKGDSAVAAAGAVVAGTPNLQQLVLDCNILASEFTVDPFSQLTSLSSLTLPNLGQRDQVLEVITVLEKFPALKQLQATKGSCSVFPVHGLEVATRLSNLTSVKLLIRSTYLYDHTEMSGGLLEVS
jgi:hypothetical protein